MENTTPLAGDYLLRLDPLKSQPTPVKVEEIIKTIIKIPKTNDLQNKVYDFYSETSKLDLSPGQVISYFLRHSKFFFKTEPDINDLQILLLKEGECEPTPEKLNEITDYIMLLAQRTLSPTEVDDCHLIINNAFRTNKKFPDFDSVKSEVSNTLKISLNGEGIVSSEQTREEVDKQNKQRSIELALKLKIDFNKEFTAGKDACIVTESIYQQFVEIDGIADLEKVTAEFEKSGFELVPMGETLVIRCKKPDRPKPVSFKEFISKLIFKNDYVNKDNFLTNYIKQIEEGKFKDKTVYGIKENTNTYKTVDYLMTPNSFFCGAMGTGKSIAMKFSCVSHMLNNSENSLYFFVDSLKGMTDFNSLFNDSQNSRENVITLLNDSTKFNNLISFLHEELEKRREIFISSNKPTIRDYNIINTGTKLVEIHIYIEEFAALMSSLKFTINEDVKDSISNKFKTLIRVGRSMGIYFHVSSQRASHPDIPSSLRCGLYNSVSFYTNSKADKELFGQVDEMDKIKQNERGRAVMEDGIVQFPYLTDENINDLMSKYFKKGTAQLAKKISFIELDAYLNREQKD